jgi:hypothetical protein
MKKNKFEDTSSHRQFKYADEYINKAAKYSKLAKKSIDQVTI